MARKKIDFSVEEVLVEVAEMFNFVDRFVTDVVVQAMGDEQKFYLSLLGIEESEVNPDLLNRRNEMSLANKKVFTVEKIKKDFGSLVYDIEETYEYVVNGVTPSEAFCFMEGWMSCVSGMDSLDKGGIISLLQLWLGYVNSFPSREKTDSKYEILYDSAYAKMRLDGDHDLNLETLALLAGVDERTVRNAVTAGNIATIKSGSDTLVANQEARRWLNSRPDFKPTKYRNEDIANGSDVTTATAFGQFIALKREAQNLTIGDVTKDTDIDVDTLLDLEKGIDRIHLSQISKLQNILKIEDNSLLNNYMRIFHWEEFTSLKHLFQAEFASKPKSDVSVKKVEVS